jgi:YwiC-like protein
MVADEQAVRTSHLRHARTGVRVKTIALPAEHGGWGFLLEPIVLGLLVAPSIAGFYLALSAVGFFLARQPLTVVMANGRRGTPRAALAKRFVALYLFAGACSFVVAILFARNSFILPLLIAAPFAVVQFAHDWGGRRRVLISELSGVVAITSLASAIALADGWSAPAAFGLWGVMIARALPAIFYVRACLAKLHDRPWSPLPMLLAHALALFAVLFLIRAGLAPRLALAAMMLLLLRAAIVFPVAGKRWLSAKYLGFSELGFGGLTVTAFVVGWAIHF